MDENTKIEHLASIFHEIYQKEARRQGDIRHADRYEDLPENVKEFDRVLARYVLQNFQLKAEVKAKKESNAVWKLWEKVHDIFSDPDGSQTTHLAELMEIKKTAIKLVDSLKKEAEGANQ